MFVQKESDIEHKNVVEQGSEYDPDDIIEEIQQLEQKGTFSDYNVVSHAQFVYSKIYIQFIKSPEMWDTRYKL